jgi:hypothetical protein
VGQPVAAQLLYAELLAALMDSRLVAAGRWSVPTSRLVDECGQVDPALTGWIAVNARRPFSAELLPALRRQVRAVADGFAPDSDIATRPSFAFADFVEAISRRRAAAAVVPAATAS